MLVVYNIHDCDTGLRTLREHATYYGEVQVDNELLPYDINGDDCDDIKRAAYLIIINPLPCGLGVKMPSVQEPPPAVNRLSKVSDNLQALAILCEDAMVVADDPMYLETGSLVVRRL